METFDERERGAKREEEATNLPSQAEGSLPCETVVAEPVMKSGTTDVSRSVPIRKPLVRFSIDEYVT